MNEKDQGKTDDQAIVIEDLSAEHAETIQGGRGDNGKMQTYLSIELENTMVSG